MNLHDLDSQHRCRISLRPAWEVLAIRSRRLVPYIVTGFSGLTIITDAATGNV
jgi:hypothetical protein